MRYQGHSKPFVFEYIGLGISWRAHPQPSLCTVPGKNVYVICFQDKSSHVHAFRSLPQQLEKTHVYIGEIFNYLYFRILTLFNFPNGYVERGTVNSNDKVVALEMVNSALVNSPIRKRLFYGARFSTWF
jgi:hypothetical protein